MGAALNLAVDNPLRVEALRRVQRPGLRRNLAKSATRALDILEYFAVVRRPLRAADIAQEFDLHRSSTDQLLKTLVDSAYLTFNPKGKLYFPSPRLARFGAWVTASYFGDDRIGRMVEEVFAATGETVTLTAPLDYFLQVMDVLEPPGRNTTVTKGVKIPMLGSAIGIAYLASQSDSEIQRIIGRSSPTRPLPEETLRDLYQDIDVARRNGYASGGLRAPAELWSLALVLPRPLAGTSLVIGLSGAPSQIKQREAELVAKARDGIDRWLREPSMPSALHAY